MKLGLIGYGKMGKMIESVAQSMGHAVVACLDSKNADFSLLKEADVCFEFTKASSVLHSVQEVASLKKNLIVGTTGWEEDMPRVFSLVKKRGIGLLYAPNFSIGAALFRLMIRHAAKLIAPFEEYDVSGVEMHHSAKCDCPSGTAKELEKELRAHLPLLQTPLFSSVRCGAIPGTHQVLFDSPDDTIELVHRVRNRESFARGALLAAEWIIGKRGMFTFHDCIEEKWSCISRG
jgi:4-hydroxy-tetrahydrodipicolinate reductase